MIRHKVRLGVRAGSRSIQDVDQLMHCLPLKDSLVANLKDSADVYIFLSILSSLSFCGPFSVGLVSHKIPIMPLHLFLFVLFVGLSSGQLKQCYDQDGTPSDNLPCDPSANVTACCGLGSTCNTNLYCTGANQEAPNFWLVGTCTDPTYQDPACPLPLSSSITLIRPH